MASGVAGTYRQLLGAQARSQASYRTSFVIDLAGNVLVVGADLLAVLVLFRVTPALGGFAVAEVVLMFGLAGTGFALADLLVGNIERLRLYVRTGLLDAVLVRPLGVLPQLLALDFQLRRFGRLAYALAVLGFATAYAEIAWTPARVGLVVLAPLSGAVFFGAIFVAGATVAFWWVDSGEVANAFTYGGREFTSYPVSVYSGWFRRLFGYGLGFAFVAYYPALGLLGRSDPLGLPAWTAWAGPAVSALAAAAAGLLWRTGVRHYRSTGS
ncbi:MAG TPA: ABC-2 family transporter protein [Micromonosporaceae bacterium]|nr:ABC-2 family transporter protein [Micromonosporaceae bacterium]